MLHVSIEMSMYVNKSIKKICYSGLRAISYDFNSLDIFYMYAFSRKLDGDVRYDSDVLSVIFMMPIHGGIFRLRALLRKIYLIYYPLKVHAFLMPYHR